ncbi:MAG: hypothetical protein ACKV2T_22320 [Kofleriaceae bacterium]
MKPFLPLLSLVAFVTACTDDAAIDSNEEARRAYLGLDTSIAKSINLGFQGFNTAQSANIAPQSTSGMLAGMLTVTGQVDQGNSVNKGMRLHIGMVAYTDGEIVIDEEGNTIEITYDTDPVADLQPFLSMQLKNIPTGTLDGTLTGTYLMTGGITGEAELNLTFTGTLMDDGNGGVVRATGSTHVTGTVVTPDDGTFDVDITI